MEQRMASTSMPFSNISSYRKNLFAITQAEKQYRRVNPWLVSRYVKPTTETHKLSMSFSVRNTLYTFI